MTKKITVNDVAHLLEDNGLIEVIFENDNEFYYDRPRYKLDEIVDKYGERVVIWITQTPEDGDERMTMELEGAIV